jgi:hypothetical protein
MFEKEFVKMNNLKPLFYFCNDSNNVQQNSCFVHFHSTKTSSHHGGLYVYDVNIRRSVSMFAFRALTKHTWMIDQDVYVANV